MTDFLIVAGPRIHRSTFTRILREAESPAAPVAHEAWAAIVGHGVDPALALAVFQHELSFGTRGAAVSRRNWGNLRRSPNFKSDKRFVVYPSWVDGAGDAARLLAIYGHNRIRPKIRTDTARTFPFVWAPSADGNRPGRYGKAVVVAMKGYIKLDRTLHQAAVVATDTAVARVAPKPAARAPAPRTPVVATRDRSRVRTRPDLTARIVRTVDAGCRAVARRTVKGAGYVVLGDHSDRWVELVELDGSPVATPLFSAAVLWRRA